MVNKKYMKKISITLAMVFIVITLGFVDINLKFSDGAEFNYKGWNHIFFK